MKAFLPLCALFVSLPAIASTMPEIRGHIRLEGPAAPMTIQVSYTENQFTGNDLGSASAPVSPDGSYVLPPVALSSEESGATKTSLTVRVGNSFVTVDGDNAVIRYAQASTPVSVNVTWSGGSLGDYVRAVIAANPALAKAMREKKFTWEFGSHLFVGSRLGGGRADRRMQYVHDFRLEAAKACHYTDQCWANAAMAGATSLSMPMITKPEFLYANVADLEGGLVNYVAGIPDGDLSRSNDDGSLVTEPVELYIVSNDQWSDVIAHVEVGQVTDHTLPKLDSNLVNIRLQDPRTTKVQFFKQL